MAVHIKQIVAVGLTSAMLTACGSAAMPTPTPAPAKPAVAEQSAAYGTGGAAPLSAPAPTKPAAAAKPAEPARPAAAAAPAGLATGAMARANDAFQAAPPAAPAPATNEAKSELPQTVLGNESAWLDREIIRNATLSVWTDDVETAVQKARQIADLNGGFVSASNTRTERVRVGDKDEDRQLATLTVQVPVQQLDRTMDALRQLGKVESEVGTSQDVTEEFVDLSANVQNLRKTEEAIQAMLARATQLQDVMTLTRELTQIRGQIERLEGRKRFLEKRSDLSSVTVSLQPPPLGPTPTPTPAPVWDPSRTAERGWNASLRVLRGIAEVGILAVAFGWWLVPLAAIAGAVALRVRRPASPQTDAVSRPS
jgi:hypothetical protein